MTPSPTILSMILLGGFMGLSLSDAAIAQTATMHSIKGAGQARLQREQTTGWQSVRQGTAFRQGDQLWTDKGVTVYVKCPNSNNTTKVVARRPKGLGAICLRWPNRDWRGAQAISTLGGIDPTLPYLISPRHSLILTSTPHLRWNPLADAKNYTVIVSSPTDEIWRIQTTQSTIRYAGPALTPGIPYTVTITSDTGQSSDADASPKGDRATNLDFRILRPSEADLIQTATTQISANPGNDIADALAIARLYQNFTLPESVMGDYGLSEETFQTYSLTLEAIALLESVLKQQEPSSLLHRTLGDLYWQTGLIQLATDHYQQAIQLTESLIDLEDWTLSHAVLAHIYVITTDYSLALQSFQQARVGYRFLGNDRLAKQMQRRVKQLEKLHKDISYSPWIKGFRAYDEYT